MLYHWKKNSGCTLLLPFLDYLQISLFCRLQIAVLGHQDLAGWSYLGDRRHSRQLLRCVLTVHLCHQVWCWRKLHLGIILRGSSSPQIFICLKSELLDTGLFGCRRLLCAIILTPFVSSDGGKKLWTCHLWSLLRGWLRSSLCKEFLGQSRRWRRESCCLILVALWSFWIDCWLETVLLREQLLI